MLLLSNLPPPASDKKSSMRPIQTPKGRNSRRGSTPPAPAPPPPPPAPGPPKRRNRRSGNPAPAPPPPAPAPAPPPPPAPAPAPAPAPPKKRDSRRVKTAATIMVAASDKKTMALLAEAGGSDAVHPPGFRFCPTDLELVAGFLSHKVHGHSDYLGADWACSLSAGDPIIPTVDLYEGEDAYPWLVCKRLACLHTMGPTEFYCFTPRRKKYGGCDFNNRSVGDYGTWHGSHKSKIKNGEVVVGYKVNLTFKFKILPRRAATGAGARNGQSKKKDEMKNTHWVMHEYTLKKQGEEEEEEVHDMVLCRVRKFQEEKGEWETPWWEKEQPQPLQEEEARGKKRKQCTRPAASSSNFIVKEEAAAGAPTAKKSKQQRRGPATSSNHEFIVKEQAAAGAPTLLRPEDDHDLQQQLEQQAQQRPAADVLPAAPHPAAAAASINGEDAVGFDDQVLQEDYAFYLVDQDDSPTPQLPEDDDLQQQRRDGDLIGSNGAAPLMSTAGGPDGAQCVGDISAPHQAAAPSTSAGGAGSGSNDGDGSTPTLWDWLGDPFFDDRMQCVDLIFPPEVATLPALPPSTAGGAGGGIDGDGWTPNAELIYWPDGSFDDAGDPCWSQQMLPMSTGDPCWSEMLPMSTGDPCWSEMLPMSTGDPFNH